MVIRRLKPEEHGRTRDLYEEVFLEDDKAFVDYYYKWKVRDSRIYVAEDGGEIQAMVHLNPFLVSVRGEVQRLHYIVAVATQKQYRHRGLMRALLELAEQEMARDGEQFTFLMPAAEQIYAPLGYRFFSRQRCGILRKALPAEADILAADLNYSDSKVGRSVWKTADAGEFCCCPVRRQEYAVLADFVNKVLKKQYDVFIYRDADYYERLCAEQECQGGRVMVIRKKQQCGDEIFNQGEPQKQKEMESRKKEEAQKEMKTLKIGQDPKKSGNQIKGENRKELEMQKDEIIGTFCTTVEDGTKLELREVILAQGYIEAGREALLRYVGKEDGCKVSGCQPELFLEEVQMKPLLMGKIPCRGIFCSEWDADRVFINEVV